jgi:hypothetical protein
LVCSDLRLRVVVFLAMLIHRAQVQIMCQLTVPIYSVCIGLD